MKLLNRADDGIVQSFYYGIPYRGAQVLAITSAFASKGAGVLDIGANTGIHSLVVAMANPSINVIAIEPYLVNYDRMRANLALNGVTNVICKNIALGARRGVLELFVPTDGRTTDVSSAIDGIGERVYGKEIRWQKANVTQCALDDILDEVADVGFIKCDVEGYELEVFKGASAFFAGHLPTFVVEILLNEQSVSFFNDFSVDHSYTIYYLTKDGLVRMDELYQVDWQGDFLFSQYRHPWTFVPTNEFGTFAEVACTAEQARRPPVRIAEA